MNTFAIIVIAISIFLLSYSWFLFCAQKNNNLSPVLKIFKQLPAPLLIMGSIGCLAAYWLAPEQQDALFELPVWSVCVPFASALAVTIILNKIPSEKIKFTMVFALCLLNTFLLPQEFSLSGGLVPWYGERILLALAWSLFAFFYTILNGVEGIVSIQSLSICLGLLILSIIGMMPEIDGAYSGIFIAMFLGLAYITAYPTQLNLKSEDCRLIGFLIGWLGLLTTLEGNGSCFLILSMYYIYETIIASIKRLSFKDQFKRLSNNTFYGQLASVGISPKQICALVSKINLIMMLMSGFQIYAPNNYTLIIIAFFMVFWVSSKIMAPETESKHLLLSGSLMSLVLKDKKSSPKKKGK